MSKLFKLADELRSIVKKHGKSLPKKHGSWVILRVPGEGTFFSLDTWNGALHYKHGSGRYNFHTGFVGKSFFYFGCHEAWGGLEHKLPLETITFYIEKAMYAVERSGL